MKKKLQTTFDKRLPYNGQSFILRRNEIGTHFCDSKNAFADQREALVQGRISVRPLSRFHKEKAEAKLYFNIVIYLKIKTICDMI